MRCSRSSDDQFDDYDGELQHLVVHHGGGHQSEGGGGAYYLISVFGSDRILRSYNLGYVCVTNTQHSNWFLILALREIGSLREKELEQKSLNEGSWEIESDREREGLRESTRGSIQRALISRVFVHLKLKLRSGGGAVPGVGLQSLQADEEGAGQVSVSAALCCTHDK